MAVLLQEQFGSRIKVMARPDDADTATARGAALYGLAGKALVTTVICPRAYLMKVRPAPRFNYLKRPLSPVGEATHRSGRLAKTPCIHT